MKYVTTIDRCYFQVADGIATTGCFYIHWQMLWPGDRWIFLKHLNSIDPSIQFTSEECREDGSMPFLDILLTPREDGSLSTTVYRKPRHTDLYLQ